MIVVQIAVLILNSPQLAGLLQSNPLTKKATAIIAARLHWRWDTPIHYPSPPNLLWIPLLPFSLTLQFVFVSFAARHLDDYGVKVIKTNRVLKWNEHEALSPTSFFAINTIFFFGNSVGLVSLSFVWGDNKYFQKICSCIRFDGSTAQVVILVNCKPFAIQNHLT